MSRKPNEVLNDLKLSLEMQECNNEFKALTKKEAREICHAIQDILVD